MTATSSETVIDAHAAQSERPLRCMVLTFGTQATS